MKEIDREELLCVISFIAQKVLDNLRVVNIWILFYFPHLKLFYSTYAVIAISCEQISHTILENGISFHLFL